MIRWLLLRLIALEGLRASGAALLDSEPAHWVAELEYEST